MNVGTTEKKILLEYDGLITISVGKSRKSKSWKTKQMTFSSFVTELANPTRTSETQKQYAQMTKEEQDGIKDIGGFVGGSLTGGRRTANNMGKRQLITLDVDYGTPDFWDVIVLMTDFGSCLYSTHKHSNDNPRYRWVIPLSKPVDPDQYQAIARKLADYINIDLFDDTTFQPHRLMYWPSCSTDGPYVFKVQDARWLNPDSVLDEYDDWADQSEWPFSSRVSKVITREMKKQQDPLEKEGVVGGFCRTYSIDEAISTFLGDVYTECPQGGRYTYTAGSSTGGAVVYEDKFLYSHHSTDPASMQLLNAFDLVRVHKFGELDEGSSIENPAKLPSFKAMCEMASNDPNVKILMVKERRAEAGTLFEDLGDEVEEENLDWADRLKCDKKTGRILSTRENIRLILENDPTFKGMFGWDAFAQRIAITGKVRWRHKEETDPYWNDSDDAQVRYLLETLYDIDSKPKIEDEILNVANLHAFHRVRSYLNSLEWDGIKRMETLFIDYLGAEDNKYTRTVTRKMMIAAVGRIFQPGLKFDNMIVLEGAQGLGKSYMLKNMGGDWFSDSLTTVQGKEAYEQLRGAWIIEMSELAALKKSEVEPIKQFISKQVDTYRVSYGRRLSDFPRQCIFVGTTNEATFLRDRSGNRRFWPVRCGVCEPVRTLWSDDIKQYIDLCWAEALSAYKRGESVWIGKEMEKVAEEVQAQHTEDNPLVGMVAEYLEKDLPGNWYDLDLKTRRTYLTGQDDFELDMSDSFKRSKVCPLEVWVEVMGGDVKRFDSHQRKEIRDALSKQTGWEAYKDGRSLLSFGKWYGKQRCYTRVGSEDV